MCIYYIILQVIAFAMCIHAPRNCNVGNIRTSVSSTYDQVARGKAPPIAKSVGPYSAGSHADPSKSPIFVERFIKCIRRYLKTSFTYNII